MSRAQILTLLSFLLVSAVFYAWWATPRQRHISDSSQQARNLAEKNQNQNETVPDEMPSVAGLDFDQARKTSYNPPKKNLFGPLYTAPKVRPPEPVAKRPSPRRFIPPPQPVQQPVQPVIQDPFPQINALGFLEKQGIFTVFLSDQEGKIYLVNPGDVFGPDLQVEHINEKEITLKRLRTGQRKKLTLEEPKSQRIPNVKFQSGRPRFEMEAEPKIDPRRPTEPPGQPTATPQENQALEPAQLEQPGLMIVPGGAME